MKNAIIVGLTISVLTLGACSGAEAPPVNTDALKEAAQVMDGKTSAVLIYADWCGSCKVLDPKIKQARAMGDIPGLDFITLDYTDKSAENFYAQATAAGVENAVKTYLDGTIKTGMLLLIDVDDDKVIGKVTKDLNPKEIVTALKEAVATS
jgi:thiol-disulfide isomerase/thioredoxin